MLDNAGHVTTPQPPTYFTTTTSEKNGILLINLIVSIRIWGTALITAVFYIEHVSLTQRFILRKPHEFTTSIYVIVWLNCAPTTWTGNNAGLLRGAPTRQYHIPNIPCPCNLPNAASNGQYEPQKASDCPTEEAHWPVLVLLETRNRHPERNNFCTINVSCPDVPSPFRNTNFYNQQYR